MHDPLVDRSMLTPSQKRSHCHATKVQQISRWDASLHRNAAKARRYGKVVTTVEFEFSDMKQDPLILLNPPPE